MNSLQEQYRRELESLWSASGDFMSRIMFSELPADAQQSGRALSVLRKDIRNMLDATEPLPVVIHCPKCGTQHVDGPEPDSGWTNPPHKSHLCHSCGTIWRPADVPTNGVEKISTRGDRDTWPDR